MSLTPQQIRASAYQRNMTALRLYKESHPCSRCGQSFPHYVMEFAPPAKGLWSVSRLAGSRCTLETLTQAMKDSDLLCANCHCISHFSQARKHSTLIKS